MYNESRTNRSGINWISLILKALVIIVVIVIILLLLPKKQNLTAFYSNVFRENISYMQDAARSYYTNERLPKNIGDSSEMTLQDMIDKNLILPFVDKDGKSCDTENSYVQVTKDKNEYILKVNLVCGDEKAFIEENLGCYDYCEDCEQEEEKTPTNKVKEYQFKQAYSADKKVYTCDSSYDNAGSYNTYTQCKKTTSTNNSEVIKTVTYTCGSEYDNAGSYNEPTTCIKTTTDKSTKKTTTTYTCPAGYDNAGTYNEYTQCKKTTTSQTSKQETAAAVKNTTTTKTYTCDSSYSNAGTYSKPTTCTKTVKEYTDITKIYEGMKNSSVCTSYLLGKCVAYKQVAVYSYVCPSGYTKTSDNTCYKNVTKTAAAKENSTTKTTYTCGSGYDNAGTYSKETTCVKTVKGTANNVSYAEPTKTTKTTYTCGSLYDNKGTYNKDTQCLKTIREAAKANTKITSTCKDNCLVTTTSEPTVSTQKVTAYRYQWSTKTSLDGWTFTGATREK